MGDTQKAKSAYSETVDSNYHIMTESSKVIGEYPPDTTITLVSMPSFMNDVKNVYFKGKKRLLINTNWQFYALTEQADKWKEEHQQEMAALRAAGARRDLELMNKL